jgi:hypothetical protein
MQGRFFPRSTAAQGKAKKARKTTLLFECRQRTAHNEGVMRVAQQPATAHGPTAAGQRMTDSFPIPLPRDGDHPLLVPAPDPPVGQRTGVERRR